MNENTPAHLKIRKKKGLLERQSYRCGKREIELPSTSSTPQLATMAEPGQSQDPGTASWSPMLIVAAPLPGPLPAAFPGTLAENWMGSGAVGTRTPTHMGFQHPRQQPRARHHNAGHTQVFNLQEEGRNRAVDLQTLRPKCASFFILTSRPCECFTYGKIQF